MIADDLPEAAEHLRIRWAVFQSYDRIAEYDAQKVAAAICRLAEAIAMLCETVCGSDIRRFSGAVIMKRAEQLRKKGAV